MRRIHPESEEVHQLSSLMQNTIGSKRSALTADVLLTAKVERALRSTGCAALRDVRVLVSTGFVILRGKVPSYYMKQNAQEAALSVPGVAELANELEVVSPDRRR